MENPIITSSYDVSAQLLLQGKVGVVPSDTIYGISCLAKSKEGVERIYSIKGREHAKPFIVLISSVEDLKGFGCELSAYQQEVCTKYWPGKVTIILGCTNPKFTYLHRGVESLGFRLPHKESLIKLLQKTGPIVSTSANISGKPNVKEISEALDVFGSSVDFYLDEGKLEGEPSRIVSLKNGAVEFIR